VTTLPLILSISAFAFAMKDETQKIRTNTVIREFIDFICFQI